MAVSSLGDGMTLVALAFAVLQTTHSVDDVGLVLAFRVIPLIILLLLGGVIADRRRRERVMMFAQLACGIFQGILAILLLSHDARLWMIALAFAGLGCAESAFLPAASGMIRQLVPVENLPAANGLVSIAQNMGLIVGPALGGLVVAFGNPGVAIGIDAATFIVSSIALSRIRRDSPAPEQASPGTFSSLRAGWTIVRSTKWLWSMILFFGLFQLTVLSGLYVLGPDLANTALGGAKAWGVMLAASGIGSVLGGALALHWYPRRLLVGANIAVLGMVPIFIVLGLGGGIIWGVATMLLYGCSLEYGNAMWISALQSNVPPEKLSRVASYDYLGSVALRPIGLALAGPLAAVIGIRAELLGIAIVVVSGSFIMVSIPEVRQVGILRQAPPESPQPSPAEIEIEIPPASRTLN
jgi:MFS family permease